MIYCRYCGQKIHDDAMFCRHCGRPVARNQNRTQAAQVSSYARPHNYTWLRIVLAVLSLGVIVFGIWKIPGNLSPARSSVVRPEATSTTALEENMPQTGDTASETASGTHGQARWLYGDEEGWIEGPDVAWEEVQP